MKKLFYRLSSSRSFTRLFLLFAFVALGLLFAQQAVAQDLLGWVPDCAPNCPADGTWDAHLTCGQVQGLTTITHNPPSGSSVLQQGTVDCTFTDTANTCTIGTDANCTCSSPPCAPGSLGFFQETAQCSLSIQFANLSETCSQNPDGT